MSNQTARSLIIFVYTPCVFILSFLACDYLVNLVGNGSAFVIFLILWIPIGRSIFVFLDDPDKFLEFIKSLFLGILNLILKIFNLISWIFSLISIIFERFSLYASPDNWIMIPGIIQKAIVETIGRFSNFILTMWSSIIRFLIGILENAEYWANPTPNRRQPPRRSNREEEANPIPRQPPRRSNREEEANPIPRQPPRRSNREEEANPIPDPSSNLKEILASLFEISGHLTKNIGTSQEKVVQEMMNKMKLEGDQKRLALDFYHQGKRATETRIRTLTSKLKDKHQKTPEILNIFMMILMEFIYLLDTSIINSMNDIIKTISTQLEIEEIRFDSIIELTRVRSKNIKELELPIVCKIIGISNPTVNIKVIQRAAKSLKKTYHPDALRKKGLPKEMLVFGTQLSQTFNSIYDNHFKKR